MILFLSVVVIAMNIFKRTEPSTQLYDMIYNFLPVFKDFPEILKRPSGVILVHVEAV